MKDLITQARAVEARFLTHKHWDPEAADTIAALCTALEAAQAEVEAFDKAENSYMRKAIELEAQMGAAPPSIKLNKAEIQSGVSRVRWAEGLIRQLPEDHDGRNSWLLNYSDAAPQAIVDALEGKSK